MTTSKADLINYQSNNHLGVPESRIRDINVVVRTSGSTGNPLSVSMNSIDFEKITDVGAKCFINAGVKPGMRIIHCMNFQMWAGGCVDFTSLMKSGAAVFPYGTGNTKGLIDTILYYDIEGISCTPSYMRRIKEVLRNEFNMHPKNLGLRYGFFGGESGLQNPNFRKSIEEEWGIEALNANYGSADTISMFASENYLTRDGLQFMADDIAVASIKVGDQILAPSKGLVGELLITTKYDGGLIKRTNYNIGDIVEVLSDGPNFKFNVLGRSDEMIVIRGLNVYPNAIRDIVAEAGLTYGFSDIQWQLKVSKEDPIEDAYLSICVDNLPLESFEDATYGTLNEMFSFIYCELRSRLSLNINVSYSMMETSGNDKIKRVWRCLD